MRLSVAEKLYPLCPTTEYCDMPINEINKCIDKFHKKNPSFPETVGDWAEHEMICRRVNYRRSIINNTSNVCETQETNKSAKTHKANVNRVNINRVKRKRVVCNEIKSNKVDVVIKEGYDDNESQHSEIEKHSKRKSKTRKIFNDASSAAKYHKLQSDNNYEDVETSGQECKAIETDNYVSLAEKCPTRKTQLDNDDEADIEVSDQESEAKEAIKNTTSTTKPSGRKFKANQPNEEVIEVPDQESEAKGHSGRRPKAKQPNNDDEGRPGRRPKPKQSNNDNTTTGQKRKAKESIKDSPSAIRRSA
ncbi:hypothetical protein C1646_813939 [Rhizophagus diaphanus]|nr:hypothetical protein C1646_813939 [Rhizophagus diaphanus] [Rhizophagus sp. MUCL 43196]